jgi:hypothetical protein
MEGAPENGKESAHSVHASGMNEWMNELINEFCVSANGIWTSSDFSLSLMDFCPYHYICIIF